MPPQSIQVIPVRTPSIGRCESCLYWKATADDGMGYCRRYPPRLFADSKGVVDRYGRLPSTSADSGCGEFASRVSARPTPGDNTQQRTRMSDG